MQKLYCELLKNVKGITMHCNPAPEYDSNFWLCTATLDPDLKIKGQKIAYKTIGQVGSALARRQVGIAERLCRHDLHGCQSRCRCCYYNSFHGCGMMID